jgi:hypothetical protein
MLHVCVTSVPYFSIKPSQPKKMQLSSNLGSKWLNYAKYKIDDQIKLLKKIASLQSIMKCERVNRNNIL